MKPLSLVAGILWAGLHMASAQQADLLIGDFEGRDYGSWKATGEAFGPGPARGTLDGQMKVDGFEGKGLVNSFFKGDVSTGTLTSPEFRIERRFIRFLIGGGKDEARTCMHLKVGGATVRTATGPNDRPGGTEALAAESWDVTDLAGRTAVIEIVDQATGGWGHINVDHIVQTDRRPSQIVANASREFRVERRYLHIPIKNGGPRRKVATLVDGAVAVENEMELADSTPDWWAVLEVGAWRGKTLTLRVDRLPDDSTGLSSITQQDSIPEAEGLYQEALRGQFHFSPQRGWNNDPNGLVFFRGEYHMFFQHNPYGWGWGNMHWGHAVSRDLVRWTELGDVLAPDASGPMFSGSAVVDWQNTSGFGTNGLPPLVLIYTAAGNPTVQSLAYSTDGRSFTKHAGNPVLKQITGGNRDPKVFWHAASAKWIMPLYVETNKVHTIHFFGSPNLKDWTFLSRNDGFYECPDFFELPVDGRSRDKRWVLTAASSEYQVGRFDGVTFTPETPKLPGHRGKGFYAAQSFSDIPSRDGRRIQVGWFQTATHGMSFNQSMTVPLELRLLSTVEGPRLAWSPVRELQTLRGASHRFGAFELQPGGANPMALIRAGLSELSAEFEPGLATSVEFNIRGARVVYEVAKREIVVNGHRAPAPLRGPTQRLTVLCDRTGLELFISDGLTYVPMPFQPKPGDLSLGVEAHGGTVKFRALQVYELSSAWTHTGSAQARR